MTTSEAQKMMGGTSPVTAVQLDFLTEANELHWKLSESGADLGGQVYVMVKVPGTPPRFVGIDSIAHVMQLMTNYAGVVASNSKQESDIAAAQMSLKQVANNISSLQQIITNQERWKSLPWYKRILYALNVHRQGSSDSDG